MLKESFYLYKRLFPFIKPYWKRFVMACSFSLPLALCSAGLAYLVKPALDDVFIKKDMKMLMLIPIVLLVLYFVKGVFEYGYHYQLGFSGNSIIKDVRNRIYAHLQFLSAAYYKNNPTGVIMSKITNDVNCLQRAINNGVIEIVKESFSIIGLSVVLFTQDLQLALIAYLILPWASIPLWRFGKKSRKISTRRQEKVGKIATFMHETIVGSRIVKAFGMEEYENRRFRKENERLLRIRMKRLKIRAMAPPLMEMIGGCAASAVVFYGGYKVLNGTSTPGTFFSFVAALLLLYGPARTISTAYQDIQEGLAAAKRIFSVLDTEPDVKDRHNAKTLPPVQGDIQFSNVQFAYESSNYILNNIDFHVQPGEVIAIVGMTGSGKTTLVNLLPRFYDITSGSICLDGHDIRDITLHSLRSQISIVSQHPYLFNDTLKNNITYGETYQDEEKIIEAAKSAFVHDFIMELPDGYDTSIGEHGVKLSGGQRQRIAIARAFLRNAAILIFDEATSSLDSQIEEQVQLSLARLVKNRTTFIISHRLSTIRNADRIIVLADGKIVEEGTHDELFQRGEEYTKLYSIFLQDYTHLGVSQDRNVT